VPTVTKSGILRLLEHSAREEELQKKKSVTIRKENSLITQDSGSLKGIFDLKEKKEYKPREKCL